MRIGTYNMLCFEGWEFEASRAALGSMDDPRRVEYFANVIKSLECDIFSLQEGTSVEYLKQIAKVLDLNLAAFPSATRFCGGVFTHYDILESRIFSQCGPKGKGAPLSRFGGATLIEHEEQRLWVVDLHTNPHTEEMRQREAAVLAHHLASLSATGYEIALMGDFNSPVTGCIHDAVRRFGLVNAKEQCGGLEATATDKQGVDMQTIDHIYLSPGLASRLRAARVVTDPGFRLQGPMKPGEWVNSDHLPVLIEVDWP
jgi:endonuclease/exonuclease/phosphatase family metal-dependent hydrolase